MIKESNKTSYDENEKQVCRCGIFQNDINIKSYF